MADTKVFSFPENNGGNDGLFGGGWGGGVLGFLLGLMFGNGGFGGFGGFGGNRGIGETAYLGNMISNDNGRDLLMQAITNNGEMSRQAVSQLATTLNQDFPGVQQSIAAKSAADQLATCQQTYNLPDTLHSEPGVNLIRTMNKMKKTIS